MAEPSDPDLETAANGAWLSRILWKGPPPPVDHIRRRPVPGDRPPVPLELPEHLLDEVQDVSVVEISGLPEGASLTNGRQISPGLWQVDPAQLASVALIPAPAGAGEALLSVGVTGLEPDGDDMITAFGTATVQIPDPPPPPKPAPKPKAAPAAAKPAPQSDPEPDPEPAPAPEPETAKEAVTAAPPKPRRRLALKLEPVSAKPAEPKRRLSLKLAPVEKAPAPEPEKKSDPKPEKADAKPAPKSKSSKSSSSKDSAKKKESKPAAKESAKQTPDRVKAESKDSSKAKKSDDKAKTRSKSSAETKKDPKADSKSKSDKKSSSKTKKEEAKPKSKSASKTKPSSSSKPDEKSASKKTSDEKKSKSKSESKPTSKSKSKTDTKPAKSAEPAKKPSSKKKTDTGKSKPKSKSASASKEKPALVPVVEAVPEPPEPPEPATPGEARVPTGNITVGLGGAPEHGDPHYRIAVDGRQVATGNVDWSLGLPALEGIDDLRICWQDVVVPWDFSDGPPSTVAVRYDENIGASGRSVRLLIKYVDVDGVRMDAFGPYADYPSGEIPWPGDASRELVSWTGDAVFNVTGAYAGDPTLSAPPEQPKPEPPVVDVPAAAEPLVIQVTRDDLRNAAVMSELTALQSFVAGREDPGIDAQRAADWTALGMVPGAWSEVIILHPDGKPIERPSPPDPVERPARKTAPVPKPEPAPAPEPAAKPEPQDLVIQLSDDDLRAPEVIEEFRAMRAFVRGEADDDPRAGRWAEMGLADGQWTDVRLLNPDGSELDAAAWVPPAPEPEPEPEPEPQTEPDTAPVFDGEKLRDAYLGETLGRALGQLEASISATEELLSVLTVDDGIRLKEEFLDSVFQRALEPKALAKEVKDPELEAPDVPVHGRAAGVQMREDYLDGIFQRAMRQAEGSPGLDAR